MKLDNLTKCGLEIKLNIPAAILNNNKIPYELFRCAYVIGVYDGNDIKIIKYRWYNSLKSTQANKDRLYSYDYCVISLGLLKDNITNISKFPYMNIILDATDKPFVWDDYNIEDDNRYLTDKKTPIFIFPEMFSTKKCFTQVNDMTFRSIDCLNITRIGNEVSKTVKFAFPHMLKTDVNKFDDLDSFIHEFMSITHRPSPIPVLIMDKEYADKYDGLYKDNVCVINGDCDDEDIVIEYLKSHL